MTAYARFLSIFSFALLLLASPAAALTTDQGGHPEKFKGGGDKVPPRCGFDVPTTADAPFFIRWNCADNFEDKTPQADIRSELWIRRVSDTRWTKVDDYLGLPASLFVDNALLGIGALEDFQTGLPVRFRLIASDTAGITSTSPVRTVSAASSVVESCDLQVVSDATESTGSTTGIPSMAVEVSGAEVRSVQETSDSISLSSVSSVAASPCELSDLCSNADEVSFSGSVSTDENGSASGLFDINPGITAVAMEGTVSLDTGGNLDTLNLSGRTTVDGLAVSVTLNCRSN